MNPTIPQDPASKRRRQQQAVTKEPEVRLVALQAGLSLSVSLIKSATGGSPHWRFGMMATGKHLMDWWPATGRWRDRQGGVGTVDTPWKAYEQASKISQTGATPDPSCPSRVLEPEEPQGPGPRPRPSLLRLPTPPHPLQDKAPNPQASLPSERVPLHLVPLLLPKPSPPKKPRPILAPEQRLAIARDLERPLLRAAPRCGLILHIKPDSEHWEFHQDGGEKLIDYWPRAGQWRDCKDEGGLAYDPWDAFKEACRRWTRLAQAPA